MEKYSTPNEGKSGVAERFLRNLKNNINKYRTLISKNVYINKLIDLVNKYNNTYHSPINMKPVDVKSNTYINSSKEMYDENPKFKIGNIVRISKYKNIFAKGYVPNGYGLKKFLLLQKFKILSRIYMLIVILKVKK